MEQRIGSNSQPLDGAVVPVVPVAAADPAYIPGITSPAPVAPEDAAADADARETATAETAGEESVPESPGEAAPESPVSGKTASDGTAADGTASGEEPAPGETSAESVESAESAESAADEDDPESDGPVFEASDRRASIKADHSGVQLRLDDQQAEFRWDEIGAVETESPRFGKRFTITVHTPDRRWYPIEIEATARARFAEWEDQLDAVLDAYFDDGTEDDADAVDAHDADAVDEAAEASEAAENEVTAEATKSKPSKPSKKSMADKAVESDKAGDEPVAADD